MSFSNSTPRLPSLRAVAAIEAAARLGSFTAAARELGVTQGAVSRQIQELERQLGVDLFHRAGPRLDLTIAGRSFALSAARAQDILRDAVITARGDIDAPHITLSMLPSVAAKWLAPRLGRFISQHPDIDLRISASRNLVSFEAGDIDAAIRYGKGKWPGLEARLLGREKVFPVCAPAYAEQHSLVTPADLANTTILHTEIEEDWQAWFARAGVTSETIRRGPRLGDDAATLQAAIDGQGVVLGRSVLVADDLAAGRLIAPCTIELEASFAYWFVTPQNTALSPNLSAVRAWVETEFLSSGGVVGSG